MAGAQPFTGRLPTPPRVTGPFGGIAFDPGIAVIVVTGDIDEAVHAQALDLALRRAGFRVLMLSDELGEERMHRALRALDPTAIVFSGPGADTPAAVQLVRRIREAGFDVPLYGFRAGGLIGDAIPTAGERPSQVTGLLNTALRNRAGQAFA